MKRVILALLGLATLLAPGRSIAQQPIKVGYPMILSGPGALFGEPALKGAQMFVDEINAQGRRARAKDRARRRATPRAIADEAVRVSRELILKDNVDFLVGTLTSAEGPAVSTIAKENKIVFIAPIPKTDQLTAADEPPSLRLPHRLQHHHRRPHRGGDRRQVAGEEDRHHRARLRLRPGRRPRPSSSTSRSSSPTSRSSTSNGRSSARPTTRPSSTRRWPRSPRPCSRRSGAATS